MKRGTVWISFYRSDYNGSDEPLAINRAEMVFVKSGTFKMASNDTRDTSEQKPVHRVFLDIFYIGKFLVTISAYKSFYIDRGHKQTEPIDVGKGLYPVSDVPFYDALLYCSRRSLKEGLDTCCHFEEDIVGDTDMLPAEQEIEPYLHCNFQANSFRLCRTFHKADKQFPIDKEGS